MYLKLKSIAIFSIILVTFSCNSNKDTDTKNDVTTKGSMFEYISAQQTGIDFANILTEDFETNINKNPYLYNGGGVGILDVNNDNLPDIYFTATSGKCKLYLNKGNFKFEDITKSANVEAAEGIKTGVTVVDVNLDGYDDLYICRTGIAVTENRRNIFYINNKNNTFTNKAAELGLDDISPSNHANFFDYDKDGDLDLYLINHPVNFKIVNSVRVTQENGEYKKESKPLTQYDSDRLYRNDNNKFTDVTEKAGIINRTFSLSVTVSDFNADGWQDIFVGNDFIEPDQLWINNKNGTFTDKVTSYFRHISSHTMGVDIADINNDGIQDIVALDMLADKETRRKALMTTMVEERNSAMVKFGYYHQFMRNMIQLGNLGGTYSDIGCLGGVYKTDWSWSPLLIDFDNDGLKDLYITNGYLKDVSNLDYLAYTTDSVNNAGGVTAQVFKKISDYTDLIPTEKLNNYIFRNKDGLNFDDMSGTWMQKKPSYSNGSAYADLDNDGDMDLIVNNYNDPSFVLKNTSVDQKIGKYLQITLDGPAKNKKGIGAKVAIQTSKGVQYQEMTPTRGYFSSSQALFHFGLGDAKQVDRIEVVWPDGKTSILLAQNANQRIKLSYAAAGNAKATLFNLASKASIFTETPIATITPDLSENTFEDFNRERLLPHKLSNLGPCFAIGDLNGDRVDDLYVGAPFGKTGAIYIQNQAGKFTKTTPSSMLMDSIYEDTEALLFDSDGDQDLDLYVVSGGNEMPANSDYYQHRLYVNDGKGNFTRPMGVLPRITASGGAVTAVDFDQDGDLDLVVGGRCVPGSYPSVPPSYLLQNNQGKFMEVTEQVFPELKKIGMVTALKSADLDGDKKMEVIIAGEWMPISVFSFQNGKFINETTKYGLDKTNGWWNCLEISDLDHDGDLDLIAGNLGTNSRLTASEKYPLSLYAKDFDKNGAIDPIITHWQDGIEYPLVMRDPLLKQIPSLKKKFLFHRDYAVASITDVFSKSDLEDALKLNAYLFSSCIFKNTNGKFTTVKLPTEAQIAPVQSIICKDLNNDGHLDLLLVGNDYGTEVETGRFDAMNGVLLLGSGKGDLNYVPNAQHGLWANGDARQMETLQIGKEKYLVVCNNNSMMQFYRIRRQ